MWPSVAQAFRRAAPPLAWYYAVTLALPLANGAAQAGVPFAEHALVVLALPPVLIVFACTIREMPRAIVNAVSRALPFSSCAGIPSQALLPPPRANRGRDSCGRV